MKYLPVFALLAFLMVSRSGVAMVIVGDKEWLNPDAVGNSSWDEINAVCPGGVCVGQLGGVDVSGYTWASIAQVNELFYSFIGGTAPSDSMLLQEANSDWAPLFFQQFSGQTTQLATVTSGWVSTPPIPANDLRYTARVVDFFEPARADIAQTGRFRSRTSNFGAWLFRGVDPVTVPVPPTLALMVLGLFVLGWGEVRSPSWSAASRHLQ